MADAELVALAPEKVGGLDSIVWAGVQRNHYPSLDDEGFVLVNDSPLIVAEIQKEFVSQSSVVGCS